jgi:hypothetical protein
MWNHCGISNGSQWPIGKTSFPELKFEVLWQLGNTFPPLLAGKGTL